MEAPPVGFAALQAAYAAWNETKGASVETWLELMADTVDFRSLAEGRAGVPWTEICRSPAEVRRYLDGLTSTFRMEHYTVDRYVWQGDTVVAIGRTAWIARATGKRLDTPIVTVLRLEGGKIASFFEYYDTEAVAEAVTP